MSSPHPPAPTRFEELTALTGVALGPTEWVSVDRERISQFAAVTGDPQTIHLSDDAAKVAGFDTPIAHGYLLLSLIGHWSPQIITWPAPVINYGLNRVRFITPVLAGQSVRARATITDITPKGPWVVVTQSYEVEIHHQEAPALVAETLIATSGWHQ